MAMILRASDLAFGYGRMAVGRDVTLSVEHGEVLCLLGPNGCGKTTLFKTLLGLLPRQHGLIELDGEDIANLPRAQFARRVAYVPQATAAFFPFIVKDVVLMGRASRVATFASPGPTDREAAARALDLLEIAHLGERPFTAISGGERQMVLIARALAQEPAMIVMDEPTASLDFGNQARVLECIRSLSASGLAVVLSTHDPGHAFACSDKVALMKKGRLVAYGTPTDVVTADSLKNLYGVDVAVEYLDAAGHHVCAPALPQPRRPVS